MGDDFVLDFKALLSQPGNRVIRTGAALCVDHLVVFAKVILVQLAESRVCSLLFDEFFLGKIQVCE
ncbi:hypothetical protein D3C75_1350760 [compost metagenome]